MSNWTFLSNHRRALVCIARDPDARLRDVATSLEITERRAYDIVNDLAEAGYIVKERSGRRNRYQIQEHLPLPEEPEYEAAVAAILTLLTRRSRVDR
jgi:hypothetical protein